MTRRALVAGAALLALVASRVARADTPPTFWERTKDPASGPRYLLHVKVEEKLAEALAPHAGAQAAMMKGLLLESARGDLEEGKAASSPDVRLRFDLGRVYYNLNRYQEAIDVLQPALALAPHHTGAADAWLDLAYAAAKLDRSALELDGYDAYLQSALIRSDLSIQGNRAEAEMRLGNLDAAVVGYRAVIDEAEHRYDIRPEIGVLARWGLAVALDRNGDPASAEHEASIAAERDPHEEYIGDLEGVFFVPEYERAWYLALGRTQHAKHATDPRRALLCWRLVADRWAYYVKHATRNDRWVGLAVAHLAAAKAEVTAAATALAKSRPSHDTALDLREQEHPC